MHTHFVGFVVSRLIFAFNMLTSRILSLYARQQAGNQYLHVTSWRLEWSTVVHSLGFETSTFRSGRCLNHLRLPGPVTCRTYSQNDRASVSSPKCSGFNGFNLGQARNLFSALFKASLLQAAVVSCIVDRYKTTATETLKTISAGAQQT